MDDELFFDVDRARNDALEIVRGSGNNEESHLSQIALSNVAPSRVSRLELFPPEAHRWVNKWGPVAVELTPMNWFIDAEGNNWRPEVQVLVRDALHAQLISTTNIWSSDGDEAERFLYKARDRQYPTGWRRTEVEKWKNPVEGRANKLVSNGLFNMEKLLIVPCDPVWADWFTQFFDAVRKWKEARV